MPDSFNCPNCGAPLDYKGSDPIIRCPFCSGSVIVPDNLRGQPSFSSQPHNFTITGGSDLGALISQARRFKDVKDLALAGNEVEAVRIYSEITGADSETARESVRSLARGMPIKLSSMNMGMNVNLGGIPPFSQIGYGNIAPPPIQNPIPLSSGYDPFAVNQKSSSNLGRNIGCGIGCFTAGFVILMLIVTLVPTAAGLMGVAVSLKPELVLTMLPAIVNGAVTTPAPIVIGELTDTPEAVTHSTPTPAPIPTATAAFANLQLSFGKQGTTPGLFADVRSITVDPVEGTIFTADYSDGRVQAFDPQGKFITQWTIQSKNPIILGMAADQKGNLYIVSSGLILVYNAQGKLLATLKPANLIDHYEDIAVLADDSLMVVSRGESVIHLSPAGKILNRIDAAISHITGKAELNSKIAVDGSGNIYLLGTFSNSVFVYNAQGKFLKRIGSDGNNPGQLRAALTLRVDDNGRIFVSDIKGIQIFSNDGSYNNVLDVNGVAFGMAFDDQGNLYLTTNNEVVEKYEILQ